MKAYPPHRHGKPQVLKLENVPEPKPEKGEVRVKLKYIGLNYAEILSRKGLYGWAPDKPYIPGMEGFGEIDALGEDVDNFELGQPVIVGSQYGNYAEKVVIPVEQALTLFDHLTEEENTAIAVNGLTAWVSLFELARLKIDDIVLVQAAAGGVGSMAVKLAKAHGNTVYGTAGSNEKISMLKDLGIDLAINYRKDDFENVIRQQTNAGVDVVLEMVGGDVFKKSVNLLNPFGRVMVMGFASLDLKKWNPLSWWKTWQDAPKMKLKQMAENSHCLMASHLGYLLPNKELLLSTWSRFSEFVNQHQIKPVVGHVLEFDQLPEAHELMESRASKGKIVLRLPS